MTPEIAAFFHAPTNTISYVVADPATGACAVDRQRARLRHGVGPHRHRPCRRDPRAYPRPRPAPRLDPRDARARRPPLGGALPARQARRAHRRSATKITTVQHTFAEIYNAERGFRRDGSQFDHLFADGERFRIGDAGGGVPGDPGPHAGLRLLQGRRQHLRRRHALHARLRHGALRLPRRRRADDVPLDPAHPRLPPADRALALPRLQGAGPRRVRLAHHGRRAARAEPAGARRRHRGRVRGDARGARTRRSARRSS